MPDVLNAEEFRDDSVGLKRCGEGAEEEFGKEEEEDR